MASAFGHNNWKYQVYISVSWKADEWALCGKGCGDTDLYNGDVGPEPLLFVRKYKSQWVLLRKQVCAEKQLQVSVLTFRLIDETNTISEWFRNDSWKLFKTPDLLLL